MQTKSVHFYACSRSVLFEHLVNAVTRDGVLKSSGAVVADGSPELQQPASLVRIASSASNDEEIWWCARWGNDVACAE